VRVYVYVRVHTHTFTPCYVCVYTGKCSRLCLQHRHVLYTRIYLSVAVLSALHIVVWDVVVVSSARLHYKYNTNTPILYAYLRSSLLLAVVVVLTLFFLVVCVCVCVHMCMLFIGGGINMLLRHKLTPPHLTRSGICSILTETVQENCLCLLQRGTAIDKSLICRKNLCSRIVLILHVDRKKPPPGGVFYLLCSLIKSRVREISRRDATVASRREISLTRLLIWEHSK